jgi:hypothetical protein
MATTSTAYRFDTDGFYNGSCLVMQDPASGDWLLPSDCTISAPAFKPGYFYKVNVKKSWTAVKVPKTCAECAGLSVRHTDNTLHSNELRALFNQLVEVEKDTYELHRDDELTLTVVKKEVHEKTLEEAKEEKLNALTTRCHAFDNQLVNEEMIINSSLGFTANADLRSQNNINGLIAAGQKSVAYMDSQNVVHSLTIAQLNTLLAECIENGQYLYQQKWAYRAQINECTSKEELEAITFEFKMKNFANE